MAEALLRQVAGDAANAYSAGLEAGALNPYVVTAMREIGIDISQQHAKTVNDPQIAGRAYDYVISVCDEASGAACPVVPTTGQRLSWQFPDPSRFAGSDEEKLAMVRAVRDSLKERIAHWAAVTFAPQNR